MDSNFTCTLPWIQSMLGEIEYDTMGICNDNQNYKKVLKFGYDFATNITRHKQTKCPAHCRTTTFDVGVQIYDDLSFIHLPPDKTDSPLRIISMYFATTEVKVSTTSKLINIFNFISSVGGNLGLFLNFRGFSFLGGFFFIFKCLQRRTI